MGFPNPWRRRLADRSVVSGVRRRFAYALGMPPVPQPRPSRITACLGSGYGVFRGTSRANTFPGAREGGVNDGAFLRPSRRDPSACAVSLGWLGCEMQVK